MNRCHLTYKYLVGLLAGVLLFSANSSIASQRQLVYEHIDVEMVLNKDTSIDVVETQRVRLSGDWNGLYRYYSLYGCDEIEIIDVSENDTAYKKGNVSRKGGYIVEQEKGKLNVKWRSRNVADPPYSNTTTTFKIRYRIKGAIGQYRKRDVLYWKPLMRDCEYRIEEASVTLVLPEAIEPEQSEIIFYSEVLGAKWNVDQQDKRRVHFSGQRIDRKDKFEIKVSLPKGLLQNYSSMANTYTFHIKPWVFPVGAGVTVLILLVLWFMVGRDPAPIPQQVYDIDTFNISPGLAGLMIDESFEVRDITATIMDLGRRGYIQIKKIKRKQEDNSDCFQFKLTRVPKKGELTSYEKVLIHELFLGRLTQGRDVDTNQLENKFYQHIPKIGEKAWQQVQALNWFWTSPNKAEMLFLTIGLIMIIPSLILVTIGGGAGALFLALLGLFLTLICGMVGIYGIKDYGLKRLLRLLFCVPLFITGLGVLFIVFLKNYQTSGWMFDAGITGVLVGSLIGMSGRTMARKSPLGAAIKQRLYEMRDRLQRGEDMGLRFEELLPWTIAFGITKDHLEHIADEPDTDISYVRFYSSDYSSGSNGAESISSVINGLSAMTSTIGSSLSSPPASSSSDSGGGFSGGGSSGGGGGGGW